MSNLVPFTFDEQPVRVLDQDGEPWFVLGDVCRVLAIANPRDAAARLDDDEKGVGSTDTPGGRQDVTTINESGLYSLVLTSRKPEAKRFKRWITGEVLPAIRKTGSYGRPDPVALLNDPATLRTLLLANTEKVLALENRVEVLQPKAEAHDLIAAADGSLCITDAAKALQVGPRALAERLRAERWTYRRDRSGRDVAMQTRIAAGDLEMKVVRVERDGRADFITEQVRITPRGLTKLARLTKEAQHG